MKDSVRWKTARYQESVVSLLAKLPLALSGLFCLDENDSRLMASVLLSVQIFAV